MEPASDSVIVEFFGVPRLLAGRENLAVRAGTLRHALGIVEEACPRLQGMIQGDGRLAPHYLISLNGHGFVTDLNQSLAEGTRVVVLSADVGG